MTGVRVLAPRRRHDRELAARLVVDGGVIGASFGSVYGLVTDGLRPGVAEAVAEIKGHRRLGRPLSVCLPEERFARLLDPARIHPAVRRLALDGDALSRTLSSLCFVRAPIRDSVADELPAHLVSRIGGVPFLQSLDPGGLPGVGALMARLWHRGCEFPAITSMNDSGHPEIVAFDAALQFSRAHALAALVGPASRRPPRALGSLTIIEVGAHGLRAVRHGVIPVAVLQALVDPVIDDGATDDADFSPLDVPPDLLPGLSHHAACRAALLRLTTDHPAGLIRQAAKVGFGHPRRFTRRRRL